MGTTVDEALLHAEEALRDYVIETETDGEPITPPTSIEEIETPNGYTLVSVPLIRLSGRSVRRISRSTRALQHSSPAKCDAEK